MVHAVNDEPLYQWGSFQTNDTLFQVPVAIKPDGSPKYAGLCRYRLLLSDLYQAGLWSDESGCLPLPDAEEPEAIAPEYLVEKSYQRIPFNQVGMVNIQAIAACTGSPGSASGQADMTAVNNTGIVPCFYTIDSWQLMGLAMITPEDTLSLDCYALLIDARKVIWGTHYPTIAYLSPKPQVPPGKLPQSPAASTASENEGLGNDEKFILAILPMLAVGLCGFPACWCLAQTCQCLRECTKTHGPSWRAGLAELFGAIGEGIMAVAGYCLKCPQCCSNLLVSAMPHWGEGEQGNPLPESSGYNSHYSLTSDTSEQPASNPVFEGGEDTGSTASLPDYATAIHMSETDINPPAYEP